MTIEIEILDPEGQVTRHRFEGSPVRIGRDAQNDLVLPFAFVSSWHGVVRESGRDSLREGSGDPGADLCYFDLGSTNGSRYRDQLLRAGQSAPAEPEHPIAIGELQLTIRRLVPSQTHPTPATPAPHSAQVELERVRSVVDHLQPMIDAARHARDQFLSAQEQTLAKLAPAERVIALAWLQGEEEFLDRRPATEQNSAFPPTPLPSAEGLLAGDASPRPPNEGDQGQALLSALVEGLFCLVQGQSQVARDLGVRAQRKKTRLHVCETPQEMQRSLTAAEVPLPERLAALQSVIHDLKVFNVAQLNAFRAGAEALLLQLSPQEIEASRSGSWTSRHKALWQEFCDRYANVCDDERAIVSTLFGPEFIRAFSHYWESLQAVSPDTQPPESGNAGPPRSR